MKKPKYTNWAYDEKKLFTFRRRPRYIKLFTVSQPANGDCKCVIIRRYCGHLRPFSPSAAVQSSTSVSAYFTSEQMMSFDFADHH